MVSYEIRNMQEEDIAQIAAIEKLVFPTPWSEAALRSELRDNVMANYLVLVSEAKPEEVLAYGGIWRIFDEGHITNIAVAPKAQGRSLGRLLLYGMMNWAWGQGLNHLTLEVRVTNEKAINLYKKAGFEEAGIRPGYYEESGEDALIMWHHRQGLHQE